MKKQSRLIFTEEERADPTLEKSIAKSEKATDKVEKAQSKIPKKTIKTKERTFDADTGKAKCAKTKRVSLHFEEVDKPNPSSKLEHGIKKAPQRAVLSAVHRVQSAYHSCNYTRFIYYGSFYHRFQSCTGSCTGFFENITNMLSTIAQISDMIDLGYSGYKNRNMLRENMIKEKLFKTKISVVTVCLNEEMNIKKTMESVCMQDYDEIEYIIKDGMSTDKTNIFIKEMIHKYKDRKLEIKHMVSEDLGIYDAMNQALRSCTGTWIIFMNSGDMFSREDILSSIFANHYFEPQDVLFGDTIVEDFAGRSIWKADLSKIASKMPFSHQSCFFKATVIKKYEFDSKQYKIAADYDLLIKLFKESYKFYYVDEIISIYSLEGISSINYVAKLKEHRQVLYQHNYIKNSKGISFYIKLFEAIVKTFIDKYIPIKWSAYLRRWYKRRIKCYQDLNEK